MNFSGMGAGVPRASKYTRWPSHSPLAAAAKSASIEAGAAETGTERARPWTPRERVPIFDREVAPVAPARTRADAVDGAGAEKARMASCDRCDRDFASRSSRAMGCGESAVVLGVVR
jgi:hypothetical protein